MRKILQSLFYRFSFGGRKSKHPLPAPACEPLTERLRRHLEDYLTFQQATAEFQLFPDQLPEANTLADEARALAFEISLIPGFNTNPILQRANKALTRHWDSLWSNAGITDEQYRVAIKSVLLFAERHHHPSMHSVMVSAEG